MTLGVWLSWGSLFIVTGVLASPYKDGYRPHHDQVAWGPCIKELAAPNLVCANLSVPLDWDDPEGEKITLGMAKLPAQDNDSRIGNLFINPGGPGLSAAQSVASIALGKIGYVGKEIREKFDIIGLDPRGVGISTRVLCDIQAWNQRVSLFPTDAQSYEQMVAFYRNISIGCRNMTGRLMDHLDTIHVVKDLEAVRRALGNERMNFLGLSYGTLIGTQYAYYYPHAIRSMVLDGNLEHYQDGTSMLLSEATSYEATLKRFFVWCESNKGSCVLAGQDPENVFKKLLLQAAQQPILAPSCTSACRSSVNAEELRFGKQPLLFNTSAWPQLASALLNATQGDASALSTPLATGDPFTDSALFTFLATACCDFSQEPRSFHAVRQKQMLTSVFAPLTAGASASYMIQTTCIGWQHSVSNPPKAVKIRGVPKILVVNALYDPSTSYTWALGVAEQFGNSAVLLTRNGSGHTSYHYTGGETSRAIDKYLSSLAVPDLGTILNS
ncbi:hypothetical protein FDECE_1819 [Fusarium decemcellulare]|nr:hypothetical protein FDECE_1819 [Fusarium decemcellulare]